MYMNYAVDRIDENIATIENIINKEKKEVPLELLPKNVKEGSIITLEGGTYILNSNEEETRRKIIEEKLNRLKNLNKGE